MGEHERAAGGPTASPQGVRQHERVCKSHEWRSPVMPSPPLLSKIELPRRQRRNETEYGVQLHFGVHAGMFVENQV